MKLMQWRAVLLVSFAAACTVDAAPSERDSQAGPAASGGSTTVFDTSHNAFGRALNNLNPADWPLMLEGKVVFAHRFRPAGEGPPGLDGLGPLYNADSCASCHFKDGRGRRPDDPPAPHPPMIFRLGSGIPTPSPSDPTLGEQLQVLSLVGEAEGSVEVRYELIADRYPDGLPIELRRPIYRTVGHRLSSAAPLSPRIPPTLVGVGLLEAVDEADILLRADPTDRDGDGISGRAQWVPGPEGPRLGRFGWKAGKASLEAQVLAALAEDLGVTEGEIAPTKLRRLVHYLRLLAPPARRQRRPEVARGELLFARVGCEACHRAELRTASAAAIPGPAELADQVVRPYTDLLLHDMGEALADGLHELGADGREWRTPPLWGLGLLAAVNGEPYFLHDGRARSFEEAILWHGGEAKTSRVQFMALSSRERMEVVRFLKSL